MRQFITWLPEAPESAAELARQLQGFNKIKGMLQCRALDLPTLKGFIVDPVAPSYSGELENSALSLDPSQVLLRHDREHETGKYPQGGYLVPISDLAAEVSWYASHNRRIICFEPEDALKNRYSASVSITRDANVTLEIVGPGFDVSDITRGYLTPHEHWIFPLDMPLVGERRSFVVEDPTYQFDKRLRILKIPKKYLDREKFFTIKDTDAEYAVASKRVRALPQLAHLLDDSPYIPAPSAFIRRLVNFSRRIFNELTTASGTDTLIAFAASEVSGGSRIIVWDIIRPNRKYV